jgi:hypothetical protein
MVGRRPAVAAGGGGLILRDRQAKGARWDFRDMTQPLGKAQKQWFSATKRENENSGNDRTQSKSSSVFYRCRNLEFVFLSLRTIVLRKIISTHPDARYVQYGVRTSRPQKYKPSKISYTSCLYVRPLVFVTAESGVAVVHKT